jgi:hypothetical protein
LAIWPRRRKSKVGSILDDSCILRGSVQQFAKETGLRGKANPSIFHDIAFLKRQDNIIGVSPVAGLVSR